MNTPGYQLFSSAELSFVLHATEDEKKLVSCVEGVLQVPAANWSRSSLTGHFGNQVATLRSVAEGDMAGLLETNLLSGLRALDRAQFLDSLSERIDEKGHLYIRLDKQQVCRNVLRLSETDPIRIRLRPIPHAHREDYATLYRRALSSTE